MHILHCLIILAALTGAAAAAEEPASREMTPAELGALLDRLERNLGSIQSLAAAFTQEKHLELFSDVVMAEGIVAFRRPDDVRLEFTQPFQSVLIARRDSVAKYECVDGTWEKIKLGSTSVIQMVTGQIATWLQGRFREKSSVYQISARTGAEPVVVLTPKSKDFLKHIVSIELTISADETRVASVVIREPEGNFTKMVFTSEQRDIPLRDDVFDTARREPAKLGVELPPVAAPNEGAK